MVAMVSARASLFSGSASKPCSTTSGTAARSGGDDGFARSYCFQENDPETFLDVGQAKNMRPIVLAGQFVGCSVGDPLDHTTQIQISGQPVKTAGLGPASYDPHLQFRDCTPGE